MWFDRDRLVRVGRPQAATGGARPLPERPTVLYAPTWEGAQPSMAYSSVLTHGPALVRSLLEAGLRVVYRPHPRTGANRRDVADADTRLREVFGTEAARRSGSVVETAAPIEAAFTDADLLVTDVSSVAVEWLPTGRPLVVTVPAEPGAVVASSPLLDAVPRLAAGHASDAGRLAWRCLREDPERAGRLALLEHYLGGLDAAAALDRFVQACGDVLEDRDRARAALPQGRR
jgi:hypothetical protein